MSTQAVALRNQSQVTQYEQPSEMTAQDVLAQVNKIQEVMRAVMKADHHYGVIPGCGDKPTLLKPGAEKLTLTFRLAPDFVITQTEFPGGHREFQVLCRLNHIGSGNFVGAGVGACSTMEGKFRYRTESTGKPVPKEYWDSRDSALLGGPAYSPRKVNGSWTIFHKVEHDNPADYYNTCLKMAKKRALVDATLTATAASDIFTQDIEEMADAEMAAEAPKAQQAQTAPRAASQPPANRSGKTITEPQQKRLWAIAKQSGWSNDEVAELLSSHGWSRTEEIPMGAAYDNIIGILQAGQQPEAMKDDIPDDFQPA